MRKKESRSDNNAQKLVGLWIRVSTDLQVESESPAIHEKRGRYYAEAKGWKIVEVYRLEAQSGRSVMDHPETQRMLSDLRKGRITGLIFSKLARLARNTKELLEFSDIFRDMEADLISLQESIDTSTPAGRLFYTMIAALTQWEREEIVERINASIPIRAKLGKPLGGAAPFGYKYVGNDLVPDEKEAPVRKLMYELFLTHQRKKTVARLLNEAGYRTRNGSKFTDTTVDRLLKDTTAKGIRRANYTRSLGEGKAWKLKPKEDWVETPIEAIVDLETWDRANSILVENRRERKRRGRPAVQLFAGIAFCCCGVKMHVPSNNPKYVCSGCHNKILISDLEEIFHHQLKEFVFSPEDIAEYLRSADAVLVEKEKLLETLRKEETDVSGEMKKTYRLYVEDKITTDGFGDIYKPLEERLKEIQDTIPRLLGEIDFTKIQYLSRDETILQFRSLYDRWTDLSQEEKRILVEHCVERISIGSNEINIELGYMPSPSEVTAAKQPWNTSD